MKDNFEKALAITLEFEGFGKTSNDPDDRGGLTKWGIRQESHPEVDIASLTREQAEGIYKRDYWDPAKCDLLPYPIDILVFDMAVNHGVARATRFLQASLNSLTPCIDPNRPGLRVDGDFGPMSQARLKWFTSFSMLCPSLLGRDLLLRRTRFYAMLIKNESQKKFIYGWLRQRVVNLGVKVGFFSVEESI